MKNYLNKNKSLFLSAMGLISIATAAEPDPVLFAKTRPLSEAESMKTFEIQDGYKVKLAAGDKFLNEPVHMYGMAMAPCTLLKWKPICRMFLPAVKKSPFVQF